MTPNLPNPAITPKPQPRNNPSMTSSPNEIAAFYAGTFDPFTVGHHSIVMRALTIFPRVVIAIGQNADKTPFISLDQRLQYLHMLYADVPQVEIAVYEGLTVDAAREHRCTHLLRGVRSAADFEYERNIADANRDISGMETVILYSLPKYSFVSSSLVRDLMRHGHDVADYLPK
jgi:pantetheine-phosphate adenylyltransferase